MFGFRKAAAVAEAPVQPPIPEDTRPKPRVIKPVGEAEEVRGYVALCQKICAETPAVRMLQLRQFLAERGIPEYDNRHVDAYLLGVVYQREKSTHGYLKYFWHPLREEDKDTSFHWFWDAKCDSSRTVYHQLVPGSVLQTVATILEAFPDAKFFVSDIAAVRDPFLLVTFPDVSPVIVDFWSEPGFRPA